MSPTRMLELVAFAVASAAVLALKAADIWPFTWLETVGFLSGLACVWLVVRRSVWNFPVGIVSCAAYLVFLAQGRLFGDAGLQVVFILLNLHGWWVWATGKVSGELRVRHVGGPEAVLLAVFLPVGTVALMEILKAVSGAAPFLDALTTTLSLIAQWLLNRKCIESWFVWIVADVIYVYLYTTREMYLTAVLYAVFLLMCAAGLVEWRRALLDRHPPELDRPPVRQ